MRISFRRRRSYGGLLREIWVPWDPPMRRVSSGSCVAMTRIDGFADQDGLTSGGEPLRAPFSRARVPCHGARGVGLPSTFSLGGAGLDSVTDNQGTFYSQVF